MSTYELAQIDAAVRFIGEAIRLRDTGVPEAVLRDNLTEHLPQMFPRLPWWVHYHSLGAEHGVKIADGQKKRNTFIDALVGRTTIEYEPDLRTQAKFDEGFGQVAGHCAGLLTAGEPAEHILGVLSDTVDWRVYAVEPEEGLSNFGRDDLRLDEVRSLQLSAADEVNAERLLSFLEQHLGRVQSRRLSGRTIAHDMGFDSPFSKEHLAEVRNLVDRALTDNPIYGDLIRRLWTDFVDYLGSQEDEQAFDEDVYVSELYLVTLAKLLCANVLSKSALISDDGEIRDILGGDFFKQWNLANLVEYDYFGWLNVPPLVDRLIPIARAIQQDLLAYDYESDIAEDLFGEVMAQLAHRTQRLLLGQEATPAWLARQVAEELAKEVPPGKTTSYLDMAGGSGALMVQVVLIAMHLAEQGGKSGADLVDELIGCATAFDIDPLAVMLAKVNWVVTVRTVLTTKDQSLEDYWVTIPVYHADSLFSASPLAPGGSADDEEQEIVFFGAGDSSGQEPTIALPNFLVTPGYRSLFDALAERAYLIGMAAAEAGQEGTITEADARTALADACEHTGSKVSASQQTRLLAFVTELATTLERLQRDGRNGIWAFILRNSYRPQLIAGQFAALITNPPWLALSKVADNPYRERLRILAQEFALKPPGPSHLHAELSTLFLLHAVERYLRAGASVACLLPDTVLNGLHHNPFRMGSFRNSARPVAFTVRQLWRIGKGTFKNEAIVLFGKKDQDG